MSRPLTVADLPVLAKVGADAFPELRPRYLRLWSAHPDGWFDGTDGDRRFLARPLTELRAGFDRTPPAELTLTSASTLEHYQDAKAAYDDVDVKHPLHPVQAALADRAALARTLAAGMLFDVRFAGDWAGYVAVMTTGDTRGMPAYVVQELVLAKGFRGRGLGPHLSTLLARALPDDGRILVGTIHAGNRGAQEAARRAGRVDVGGWLQVPLATD